MTGSSSHDEAAQRLSSDEKLRADFLASPVETLTRLGLRSLVTSPGALSECVAALARARPYVPGWSISRLDKAKLQPTHAIVQAEVTSLEMAERSLPAGPGREARARDRAPSEEPTEPLIPLPAGCDAILVVPPFADLNRPNLAVHVLQAVAARHGFRVKVVYANILVAAAIGEKHYQAIAYAPQTSLLGERFFAEAAFGMDNALDPGDTSLVEDLKRTSSKMKIDLSVEHLARLAEVSARVLRRVADSIAAASPLVVGATSSFTQTAASVTVLDRVKQARPAIVTILGGANCQGEMAEGIVSLGRSIDHVFSGECEVAFPEILRRARGGDLPSNRIIEAPPCEDMDAIPRVTYAEYYEQRAAFLPLHPENLQNVWLSYETSRGCWWGEKHHCTFCGLNGETMKMRERSAALVIGDLAALIGEHPSRSVWIVDNIMPNSYFQTLLPRLADEVPGLHVYWDQKSNLSLEKMMRLKAAGVGVIQPGIESLSTSLLRRMDKGVTASSNIATLRYARSIELPMNWNLLFAFPGDEPGDYEAMLAIMPLVHHLPPPAWLARVNIDRFSPYHRTPERWGMTRMRPHPAYRRCFPSHADLSMIAYHFVADYPSATTDPELLRRLCDAFDAWRFEWASEAPPPALTVAPMSDERWILVDTRGLPGNEPVTFISRSKAIACLVATRYEPRAELDWALERRAAALIDGTYTPLATSSFDVLRRLEGEARGGPGTRKPLRLMPSP
jgi:ribosomal peptide maturation radical SAM protein 1